MNARAPTPELSEGDAARLLVSLGQALERGETFESWRERRLQGLGLAFADTPEALDALLETVSAQAVPGAADEVEAFLAPILKRAGAYGPEATLAWLAEANPGAELPELERLLELSILGALAHGYAQAPDSTG